MNIRLRRATALSASAVALALLATACSGSSSDTASPPASSAPAKLTGTVEFWHFFTDREAKAIQAAVDRFQAANPGVKVDVKSGQDDDKTIQAIAAGQPIDVVLSYSTDQIGKFCSTGAWKDLTPYVQRDKVDLNQIPTVVRDYTQFDNKRCSMPMLSDTYGLYYNKKLLAAAGYTEPPKTLSELRAMATKLTTYDAKGNIAVAGFVPTFGFYENAPAHFAPSFGATWFTSDGKSNVANDPAWASMLTWQKSMVDDYGYDKLTRFTAGAGDEFSAANAFEKGKVAMMIDGEYRNAFIKAEASSLSYGTAPFPAADDKSDLYGSGYVTGNVIGIGRGAQNPEAAWALIKFLTTDTDTVVAVANTIKNVPTWTPALQSPALEKDANYQTFLDVFANAKSSTTPATASGKGYQDTFAKFATDWQAGKVSDLQAGLKDTAQQIDDQSSLGQNP